MEGDKLPILRSNSAEKCSKTLSREVKDLELYRLKKLVWFAKATNRRIAMSTAESPKSEHT